MLPVNVPRTSICARPHSRPLQSTSTLAWVFLTFALLAGCGGLEVVRPPDGFNPSLPPSPKVALFYDISTGRSYVSESWYDSLENAVLQALRDKGYTPVLICGLLRRTNDFMKGYVTQDSCPPEFGSSQSPKLRLMGAAGSKGDIARAVAREAAVKSGSGSILYLKADVPVSTDGRFFPVSGQSLFLQTDKLTVQFKGGRTVRWWDLSYNWLQFIGRNSNEVSNVENWQEIQQQILEKKLVSGDRVAVVIEPMEKFLKRLAGEILKDIPAWSPADDPSSATRRKAGSGAK